MPTNEIKQVQVGSTTYDIVDSTALHAGDAGVYVEYGETITDAKWQEIVQAYNNQTSIVLMGTADTAKFFTPLVLIDIGDTEHAESQDEDHSNYMEFSMTYSNNGNGNNDLTELGRTAVQWMDGTWNNVINAQYIVPYNYEITGTYNGICSVKCLKGTNLIWSDGSDYDPNGSSYTAIDSMNYYHGNQLVAYVFTQNYPITFKMGYGSGYISLKPIELDMVSNAVAFYDNMHETIFVVTFTKNGITDYGISLTNFAPEDYDYRVQQSPVYTNATYPIIFKGSTGNEVTTTTTGFTSTLYANPSTGLLQVGALGVTATTGYTTAVPSSTTGYQQGQVMFVLIE